MSKNYSGSIALTKLKHVVMEKKGKGGKKVKGLFIPIEANILEEGKENAIYMAVRVIARNEADQYGQHGFISQSAPSAVYKAATEEEKEEFKKLPILGNIKDFSASDENNNAAAETTFDADGDDDLPF